jgi:hypothetical protein
MQLLFTFMLLYNWPHDNLHSMSKLPARQTVTKSVLCMIGNIDIHYECYTNGDVPYADTHSSLFVFAPSFLGSPLNHSVARPAF